MKAKHKTGGLFHTTPNYSEHSKPSDLTPSAMNTIDQLFEQDFNDDWKDDSSPHKSPIKRSLQLPPSSPVKKVKVETDEEDVEIARMLERDLAYKSEPDDVNLATPNSLTPGSECEEEKKVIEIIEIEDDEEEVEEVTELKKEVKKEDDKPVEKPKIEGEINNIKSEPEEIHSSPNSGPAAIPEFLASTMYPPPFSYVSSSAASSVSPTISPSAETESKQNMDEYLGKIFNLSPEDDFFAMGGSENSETDSFASVKELKQQLMSQHTLMTTYTSLKDVYQRVCKSLKERNAENRRLANHMKVLVGVIEQNNKKIAEIEESSNKLKAQAKTLDKEKKALQNTIKEMHKSTDGLSKIELLRLTINLRDAEIVRLKHKCGEL